jgi:hypothetical protein
MTWTQSPGRVRGFVGRVNDKPAGPYVEVEAPDWLSPAQARRLAARIVEAARLAEQRMKAYERKQVRKKLPRGDVPDPATETPGVR